MAENSGGGPRSKPRPAGERAFALVAPENSAGIHLKALARISRLFKNPRFRESILKATTPEQIYSLIAEEDARA